MNGLVGDWRPVNAGFSRVEWRKASPGRLRLTAKVQQRGDAWRYMVGAGHDRHVETGYKPTEAGAKRAAEDILRAIVRRGY